MIVFTVPGNPVAQGRARFFVRKSKMGNYISSCDPIKSTDFKSKVALFATKSGLKVINGAVVVSLDLYLKRPKIRCRKSDLAEAIPCDKRPDVDNYAKAILDALNGIAWNDDGQVHSIRITKWYHEKGGVPRAEVTIEPL